MTVRVEKLDAPATPLIAVTVLGFVSAMTALLVRWWRQPTPLVMSDDWLSDRARSDSHQGWD
jgi:hypothetical protein